MPAPVPTQVTSYSDPVTKLGAELKGPQADVFKASVANTAEQEPLLDQKAAAAQRFGQENIAADTRLQQTTQTLQGQQQDIPKFTPTPENKDDLMRLFALTAATTFLGGGGRQSGVNALTNLSSALEGYGQGKIEHFNRQLEEYQQNFRAAQSQNELVRTKIQQAMQQWTVDRDKAQQTLAEAAALTDNGLLKHQLRQGDLTLVSKLLQQQEQSDLKLKELQMRFGMGGTQSAETTAEMIANYQLAPLSGPALRTPWGQQVMGLVGNLNPNYSANTWAERGKAVKDFATGKQGDTVRSFNVVISHLDTLEQLADALNNKDVMKINQLSQKFQEQFGAAVPASFDAARQFVGDEIVKAVIGSRGALGDREGAQATLSRASSPAQLKGVINTYKDLAAGQLKGLRKQYETSTGLDNFDQFLLPETIQQLEVSHGGSEAPAAATDKEGARSTSKSGKPIVYRNGQWEYE